MVFAGGDDQATTPQVVTPKDEEEKKEEEEKLTAAKATPGLTHTQSKTTSYLNISLLLFHFRSEGQHFFSLGEKKGCEKNLGFCFDVGITILYDVP